MLRWRGRRPAKKCTEKGCLLNNIADRRKLHYPDTHTLVISRQHAGTWQLNPKRTWCCVSLACVRKDREQLAKGHRNAGLGACDATCTASAWVLTEGRGECKVVQSKKYMKKTLLTVNEGTFYLEKTLVQTLCPFAKGFPQ